MPQPSDKVDGMVPEARTSPIDPVLVAIDRLHQDASLRVSHEGRSFEIIMNSGGDGYRLKPYATWPMGYAVMEKGRRTTPFREMSFDQLYAWIAGLSVHEPA